MAEAVTAAQLNCQRTVWPSLLPGPDALAKHCPWAVAVGKRQGQIGVRYGIARLSYICTEHLAAGRLLVVVFLALCIGDT